MHFVSVSLQFVACIWHLNAPFIYAKTTNELPSAPTMSSAAVFCVGSFTNGTLLPYDRPTEWMLFGCSKDAVTNCGWMEMTKHILTLLWNKSLFSFFFFSKHHKTLINVWSNHSSKYSLVHLLSHAMSSCKSSLKLLILSKIGFFLDYSFSFFHSLLSCFPVRSSRSHFAFESNAWMQIIASFFSSSTRPNPFRAALWVNVILQITSFMHKSNKDACLGMSSRSKTWWSIKEGSRVLLISSPNMIVC